MNKYFELKYKCREAMIKKAMITYRRFPKNFTDSQQQNLISETNNFIVKKVKDAKGNVVQRKSLSASLNLDNNFTNSKKYRSNIKLIKN